VAIRNYADLTVWQKSMSLAELAYRTTERMPRDERYGLTSQIRRAAASIPANVAEGQGRRTDGEFLRFLSLAHGSLRELQTHIELARRLEFLTDGDTSPLRKNCDEVGRLLNGLRNAIRRSSG